MAKKERKIYFYKVKLSNNIKFEDLLLDKENHIATPLDGKDVELKFVEENKNKTITGTFVATKRNGIPPKHKVNTDDYSKVELSEGQGLAYPSVMLYSKKHKILLLESNLYGAYTKHICNFFKENFSGKNGYDHFSIELLDVLTTDTYKKISNFKSVKSVNFKIASPTRILRNELGINGPIKGFAKLAKSANATESMEITLKSEVIEGGLKKSDIMSMLDGIIKLKDHFQPKKDLDRIKVEGLKSADDNPDLMISDSVNLLIDRLYGSFIIDEPPVHDDVQHTDRKKGVIQVYKRKKKELTEIFLN